ncbi:hypothetical protein FVEG_15810 [Fusarium verticillioides 7600]|uniref:Uncharacterized protein n=1 Tax=Gibberella moniliformis (strain M3125 / FGSC 7600) TaxID=334819 RepID=W7MCB4_GIBM7|nr:hypothetical protein FVEG_15810 [Fusarium verticillioides 7600]XP_018751420.1 hypothetical protein FVEG_15810 [Fusarium verticillioides 7600]XP_018751421.1 hypothetical protein FVEG_15810 [Fusarium verticillioides 7600]XP_018751422.1 hypothetical protein FVEG_15810 [Fusarium verticillioides 7600]XP_018751423.1 hypothetical protein FVEG_15810 [Fusarium verticillioides 7600]XP_018751424.1 hypothetical protein FVEG_15810 [Fusarium verticillioides 7600]XP_018751425.1 hypothetical protein FVEG_
MDKAGRDRRAAVAANVCQSAMSLSTVLELISDELGVQRYEKKPSRAQRSSGCRTGLPKSSRIGHPDYQSVSQSNMEATTFFADHLLSAGTNQAWPMTRPPKKNNNSGCQCRRKSRLIWGLD